MKPTSTTSTTSTTTGMRTGMGTEPHIVTALFRDRESAERAYHVVIDAGYDRKEINLIMSDETRKRDFSGADTDEDMKKAAEGAGMGAAIGGTLGAIAAAIAAVGTSVVIPGLGLAVAGPLAAALTGAGAGGITGGLLGALMGWGIPKEHVEEYEAGIKQGGIFLAVKPRTEDDARYFEQQWKQLNGEQVYH